MTASRLGAERRPMTELSWQRTSPGSRAGASPDRRRRRGDGRVALFFIAPVLIGFAIFYLYPTVRGVWWSFTDYSLLAKPEPVGFENYANVLRDPEFWN